MKIRLPGVCIVCRAPLVWNGRRWRVPPAGSFKSRTKHVCREDRPVCREWMPVARERCARRGGHGWEHRTSWALGNARAMACGERTSVRFGLASRARACENEQAEYSGSQSSYHAKRPLPGCTPGEGSLAFRSTDGMSR